MYSGKEEDEKKKQNSLFLVESAPLSSLSGIITQCFYLHITWSLLATSERK